jgi:AraC family transcriptional regulator of adaptative response / methylphosphotriester-DNA alkyltransferase methyltransferase
MLKQEKWDAINKSDASCDGLFYYGVTSTKVFCRPSCRSKKPLRENTVFFDAPGEAAAAGFRPCKRCRPDLLEYAPARSLCEQAKRILENNYKDMKVLKRLLKFLGVSEAHLSRLFYKEYDLKPYEYVHRLRIDEAKNLISNGRKIADAAFECGYGSLSSFYKHFNDMMGMTPKRYASRRLADK